MTAMYFKKAKDRTQARKDLRARLGKWTCPGCRAKFSAASGLAWHLEAAGLCPAAEYERYGDEPRTGHPQQVLRGLLAEGDRDPKENPSP